MSNSVTGAGMTASTIICAVCGAGNQPQAKFCASCGQGFAEESTMAMMLPRGLHVKGDLVRQRYRVLGQIGQGGFGAVYKAEDTELGGRLVAVKEMSQQGL